MAIVRFVFAVQDLTAEDRTWLAAKTFLLRRVYSPRSHQISAADWHSLSVIEVNTGLICACVPVLKPFLKNVVFQPLIKSSWSWSRTKTGKDGRTYSDDRTSRASDTALTDLEHGKKTTESASSANENARQGSSASTLKNHDFDDGKYGIGDAEI